MPHIYAHRNAVPKTMRALAKVDPVPGLKLIEALVPTPGPGEVLIRVKKTALSSVSTHIDRWDDWARRMIRPPVIVGHEFVGLVASLGPGVADFHVGELVVGEPRVACGVCRHCLGGRRQLCTGTHHLGQDRDGSFADYVCLPQGSVWHADPRLPTDVLACFAPLGLAVRIARQFDLLGAHVLVAGAGALGCMAAAIAKHAGARGVVVTDSSLPPLELARALGATLTVDTREETIDAARRALGVKDGFDLGIETSGQPAAIADLLTHLRPGGQLALIGPPAEPAPVPLHTIVEKQLAVFGFDGRDCGPDWERLTLALHGGLDITPVIARCLPLASFREAFDRAAAGEPGKIIIDWEG